LVRCKIRPAYRRGPTLKATHPPRTFPNNGGMLRDRRAKARPQIDHPGTSGDPPPSPGPPAGLPHFEFRRRSSRAPAKAATTRTVTMRPDHHKPLMLILGHRTEPERRGRPSRPKATHTPPGVPCPAWALPAEPHGSLLNPSHAVRSRGSPNFLQLVDSETHACIDLCRWGCMHRSAFYRSAKAFTG
jgi:hypothetical protein